MIQGWSIKFCFPDTKDDKVKLEVGRAGAGDSHRLWMEEVNPQLQAEHTFPEDLRYAEEIWFRATAKNQRDVHICIKYDGNNAQKMTFDEDEEHEVSKGDRDDCGC
jgi:hypothetical protein